MGIGIYIKKEKLKELSTNEFIACIQITRLIASLRFWMSTRIRIMKDEEKIFWLRDQIELCLISISMLKEAIKTYFKEIENVIKDKYITDDIENELKIFRDDFNKGKNMQEGFNLLVQKVRDNISFHYKKDVYRDIVTDGQPSEDLRIAFAKSEKIIDFIFELPYTAILTYLRSLVPEENKETPLDWIFDETVRNTDKFVSILEKIVGKIIKANGYKKVDSIIY
ncbi:MAG: hypothetical protein ACM34I_12130 [bacterium]